MGIHWKAGKYREVCELCFEETAKEDLSPTGLCPRCIDILAEQVLLRVKNAKGRFRKQPWRELQDILRGKLEEEEG